MGAMENILRIEAFVERRRKQLLCNYEMVIRLFRINEVMKTSIHSQNSLGTPKLSGADINTVAPKRYSRARSQRSSLFLPTLLVESLISRPPYRND